MLAKIPPKSIKHTWHISCGGIVYKKDSNGIKILLLHRFKKNGWEFNSWHLPKGTRRKTESYQDTVRRELREETGYQVKVLTKVGSLKSFYDKNGNKVPKITHYFLCQPIKKISKSIGEHDEVKWIDLDRAIKLVTQFPIWEKEEIILKKIKRKLNQKL